MNLRNLFRSSGRVYCNPTMPAAWPRDDAELQHRASRERLTTATRQRSTCPAGDMLAEASK